MTEINASFEASIEHIKLHDSDPENLVTVKLSVRVNRDDEKCFLGGEFKRVAFSTLKVEHGADGIAIPTWDYKSTDLGWTLEPHEVLILGNKFNVRPKVERVQPIKGEAAVRAVIAFTIDVTDDRRTFVGELVQKWRTKAEVKMSPSQAQLPLVERKGAWGNTEHVPAA